MAEPKRIMGKRILLVEDDPAARASIKLLLAIDRHQIAEASGGAEALEQLKSQPFDLVILDYFMPGMQGGQVALRIRELAPALPILMITAYLENLRDFGQAGGCGPGQALCHRNTAPGSGEAAFLTGPRAGTTKKPDS